LPTIAGSLTEGGVLIYETFAQGQETIGKPSNPDFLLAPGELLQAFAGLRVVAFEDGYESARADAPARYVQRLAAVAGAAPPPARHALDALDGAADAAAAPGRSR
jgi:hypothetical protein